MSAGWDCHAHLFGPYDRYPLAAGSELHAARGAGGATTWRCSRAWACRTACSCTRAPMATTSRCCSTRWRRTRTCAVWSCCAPRRCRRCRPARPRAFARRASVTAAAPVPTSPAARPSTTCWRWRRALADAGLHAELWTDCKALPGIADRLRELPVPVVIDHMGGFDVARRRRRRRLSLPARRCSRPVTSGSSCAPIATCWPAGLRARQALPRRDAAGQPRAAAVGQRLAAPACRSGTRRRRDCSRRSSAGRRTTRWCRGSSATTPPYRCPTSDVRPRSPFGAPALSARGTLAVRFSRNARMPSFWSSLSNSRSNSRRSSASAVSSGTSAPRRTASRIACTASGGIAAICSAICDAARQRLALGHELADEVGRERLARRDHLAGQRPEQRLVASGACAAAAACRRRPA